LKVAFMGDRQGKPGTDGPDDLGNAAKAGIIREAIRLYLRQPSTAEALEPAALSRPLAVSRRRQSAAARKHDFPAQGRLGMVLAGEYPDGMLIVARKLGRHV